MVQGAQTTYRILQLQTNAPQYIKFLVYSENSFLYNNLQELIWQKVSVVLLLVTASDSKVKYMLFLRRDLGCQREELVSLHLSRSEMSSKPNSPAPPPGQELTMSMWSRTEVICGLLESGCVVWYPCMNDYIFLSYLSALRRWLQTKAVGRTWKGST